MSTHVASRRRAILFLFLILISSCFIFAAAGKLPLIDWDEATYASIARDTLRTGNWFVLTHFGVPWFEKPPLYIWITMGSIMAFGTSEFALRLPSAVLSIIAVLLLYLLVLELCDDAWLAFISGLALLYLSPFYLFGTQSRMDVPVVAAILFSVFCFIKGQRDKRWLAGVGVGIGIGILIKSIIGLLALAPIFSYSIVYRKWNWLSNKFLWIGFGIGFLLLLPWHLYDTLGYGWQFWHEYLVVQVVTRGATDMRGMSTLDYFRYLWSACLPWSFVAAIVPWFLLIRRKSETALREWRAVIFALMSFLLLFLFFALARTKMSAYLVPLMPFLAIFAVVGLSYILQRVLFTPKTGQVVFLGACIVLLTVGAGFVLREEFINLPRYYYPYVFDEKTIGDYLAAKGEGLPLFVYRWDAMESMEFYSGEQASAVAALPNPQSGPFYLATISNYLDTLYHEDGAYKPSDEIYVGSTLSLLKVP